MAKKDEGTNADTSVQKSSVKRKENLSEKQPSKTHFLGFRIPEEDMRVIEEAAAAAGESVSEYVRKAIDLRIQGQLQVVPALSVSYVNSSFPMKIVDNKSSLSEGNSVGKSIVTRLNVTGRLNLAEDEPSQKET